MKKGVPVLLLGLAVLVGGSLLLPVKGQEEKSLPEPHWVEDLNATLTNEMSSMPAMDSVVDSFLTFWSLKGASLSIVRKDSLVYARGYGWADEAAREPMTPGTLLRMASVSKLLTAVGIMKLQEDSLLNLQSPVFGPYGLLSEYPFKDDDYCLITVEHLLRHQGGFSQRGGDPMFSTLSNMASFGLSAPPDQETLVRKLLQRRLAFVPGTGQEYSNFGYLLLSMIIEKVSGMSYADFMQQNVFAPAHCHGFRIAGNWADDRHPGETRYYMQPDSEPCPAYDGSGRQVVRCYGGNDITTLSGAGAWVGSTPELARIVASIDGLDPVPDILSPFSVYQMTQRLSDEIYSLGWNDCTVDGEWTRSGSFSGTNALVKVFPDGEIWVFISNTSAWRGSRFARNIGRFMENLRGRFSSKLPRRDLFQEELSLN